MPEDITPEKQESTHASHRTDVSTHAQQHAEHHAPHLAPEKKEEDWLRFTAETIRTVLIVIGLAYVLRFFIFEPFVVEGASMAPKFATNDYLIVDKVGYRVGEVERGDIIVFKYPNDPSTNYVKRVIGLPGETITVENGRVRISTNEDTTGFILDESAYLNPDVTTTLPSISRTSFTVTPGHFFVMGDNRPASSDSREWGLLPQENIIGRVVVQAYPLNRATLVNHARYTTPTK
ncbi:signal peptidase I [soil metagenome]